jgi:transcription elongation GreA/GreB family factor
MEYLQSEYDALQVKLKETITTLKEQQSELSELKKQQSIARSRGDLSENAELDAATQAIETLSDSIRQTNGAIEKIREQINNATIVEKKTIDENVITLGSVVTLKLDGISNLPSLAEGEKWEIVSEVLESDLGVIRPTSEKPGKLASGTIVARAIMGKRWTGRPIEVSYLDKSNKDRKLIIADFNSLLENQANQEVAV